MIDLKFPDRVWYQTPGGWSSRSATTDDRLRRNLVYELLTSNDEAKKQALRLQIESIMA